MPLKVAIASSDGLNIDLHFGQAKSFYIYELKDGTFVQTETRSLPVKENVQNTQTAHNGVAANGNAGFGGSSSSDTSVDAGSSSGFGCGSGFGCSGGGNGCGGGCGGGASGPLAPAVELLLDCRAIIAAQIGQNIGRQFQRNAISVFDIELPVKEALQKLAAYYAKF